MTRNSSRPSPGAERGSGTVLALGVVAVILTLVLALLAVGAAAIAAHRMRTAADLAAIAAASRRQAGDGAEAACAAARSLAAANGAEECRCRLTGAVAEITVVGSVRGLGGSAWVPLMPSVRASARAGPAPPRTRPSGGDYPSPAASGYVGDDGPGHGAPDTAYRQRGRDGTPWMSASATRSVATWCW